MGHRGDLQTLVTAWVDAPERFQVVDDWLAARRRMWEARLDRFDQYVKDLKEKEPAS